MAKRGKVLRDPHAGPGLLMVEGQQYPFTLEGVWKSEIPPKPGLVVDVDFDAAGAISGITAVPESQLAKEQAEAALAVAKEKGGKIFGEVVAKAGMTNLIAGLLLIIGWFFLTAVSVQIPFLGKLEYSFWQVLGFLNSSNILQAMDRNGHPSAGFYGFLAIAALAGPFIQYVWKDKRAVLGGVLPLVFMVFVWIMVRSSINSAFGGGGAEAESIGRQMQDEAMKAVSMGLGVYVSALVSLYFAGVGVKQFLAAKGSNSLMLEKPRTAA